MTVIIINPNSTESMTAAMVPVAEAAAPALEFQGWTSHAGPPAIQGAEDGAAAAPHLLDLVKKADQSGAEGVIVGCFDDTALTDATAQSSCPVVGIGQAGMHLCALRQWRFSVVTTLAVSVPVIEENVHHYGLTAHLGRVRASDIPVLALEEDPDAAIQTIIDEARLAVAEDGAQSIILGCAGMATLTSRVRSAVPVPIIDPVEAAAKSMLWLT
ncbi:MAG: aspartate/glutamate racemase family protein [Pseudomonadota bacterium]